MGRSAPCARSSPTANAHSSSVTPTRSGSWLAGAADRLDGGRHRRPGPQASPGDSLLVDTKAGFAFERVPKAEVEDLVLEEVPDVGYEDIGGPVGRSSRSGDAVELPFLHGRPVPRVRVAPARGCCCTDLPVAVRRSSPAVANSLAKKIAEVRGDDAKEAKSYF